MPSVRGPRSRTIRKAGRWFAVAAAAAVLGATAVPIPASAAMEKTPADNSQHDYCLHSTFVTDPIRGHEAMTILDGQTDLTSLYAGPCPTGPRGNSTVDVWFMEGGLVNPDARAEYRCMVFVNSRCDTANIRMDFGQIADDGGPQPENRQKTAVHEVGHSIGLADHTHTPCAMWQGAISSTDTPWRRYAASDLTLINSNY